MITGDFTKVKLKHTYPCGYLTMVQSITNGHKQPHKKIMSFEILPQELIHQIMMQLNYKQIINLPLNKNVWSTTTNNKFWQQKLIQDFPSRTISKTDEHKTQYCLHSKFNHNLGKFNGILKQDHDEFYLDNIVIGYIDDVIKEFGPYVYLQTSSLHKKLDDLFEINELWPIILWPIIENAVVVCFSKPKQKENASKFAKQREEELEKIQQKKIKLGGLDSKIQNYKNSLIELLSKTKETNEKRKIHHEGDGWCNLDSKMENYEYEMMLLLKQIKRKRQQRTIIDEEIRILQMKI